MSTTPVGLDDPDNHDEYDNVRVLPVRDRSPQDICGVCETPRAACVQFSQQHHGIRCCGQCTHPHGGQLEPQGPVVDAEIVSEEEYQRSRARRGAAIVVRQAKVVRRHPVTTAAGRAGRAGLRHAVAVGYGHVSWIKRASAAISHATLREQIRQAEYAHDREALALWQDRLRDAKTARHARIQQLPHTLLKGVQSVLVAMVILAGVALLVGVILAVSPGSLGWFGWWALLGDIIGIGGMILTWVIHLGLWSAVPAWLLVAWREGRRAATVPTWLASPTERAEQGATITADAITQALSAIKIPDLTKAIKAGVPLEFIVTPREQGGGTYCQVRLPHGVMAADVLGSATVERLAGNLYRHKHETWPQRDPDADARVLDLWVADKGAMDKPAPPWPLLHDGEVDVWRDRLPWGVTMRSEQVSVGMLQKHWLVGATSKQGKTKTVRQLALGLALDPTVELLIADLKGDGDWSMFTGRASVLIEGSSDEAAEATCTMLEWGVGEMQRRYEVKTKGNITLTREVSRQKGSGFHPIWIVVDECQILYAAPHPIGGSKDDARAWRAAKRLHDQARAVNIHLIQATQRPDNRTLPVQVREGAHVRAALNVPNAETAKLIIADAAERGARPQDLRAGRDAGTVVATGEIEDIPAGQAFTIVRTHYVDNDEAAAVVQRSIEIMHRQGRTVDQRVLVEPPEPRDFLDDLDEVMFGEPRVRTEVLRKRLSELCPAVYEAWSAQDLTAALTEVGITARKTGGGRMHVFAEAITEALNHRTDAEDAADK
jgi:DNA segregation ATPase FtsK/SpoIIIE, S-DNA-T family